MASKQGTLWHACEGDEKLPSFEEWFGAPDGPQPADERFAVRRATPDDFPKIYQLVNAAFGRNRSAADYDWLYLNNPNGVARCSLVIERSTGDFVSAGGGFPWPVAHNEERIYGQMGGDSVTAPQWQRQGISEIRRAFGQAHPFHRRVVGLGSPNASTRALQEKYDLPRAFGPLPYATVIVDGAGYLRGHKLPAPAARILGTGLDALLAGWQRASMGASDVRAEPLERFSSDLDPLTHACMRTPDFWCPHESDFLNWRYFAHPRYEYLARAVFIGDDVAGYGVIRTTGPKALLMDFVAPEGQTSIVGALLMSLQDAAREAGCNCIDFHATSGWRFWPFFRRAGFTARRSSVYRDARCPDQEEAQLEQNWQLLPGDLDVT